MIIVIISLTYIALEIRNLEKNSVDNVDSTLETIFQNSTLKERRGHKFFNLI